MKSIVHPGEAILTAKSRDHLVVDVSPDPSFSVSPPLSSNADYAEKFSHRFAALGNICAVALLRILEAVRSLAVNSESDWLSQNVGPFVEVWLLTVARRLLAATFQAEQLFNLGGLGEDYRKLASHVSVFDLPSSRHAPHEAVEFLAALDASTAFRIYVRPVVDKFNEQCPSGIPHTGLRLESEAALELLRFFSAIGSGLEIPSVPPYDIDDTELRATPVVDSDKVFLSFTNQPIGEPLEVSLGAKSTESVDTQFLGTTLAAHLQTQQSADVEWTARIAKVTESLHAIFDALWSATEKHDIPSFRLFLPAEYCVGSAPKALEKECKSCVESGFLLFVVQSEQKLFGLQAAASTEPRMESWVLNVAFAILSHAARRELVSRATSVGTEHRAASWDMAAASSFVVMVQIVRLKTGRFKHPVTMDRDCLALQYYLDTYRLSSQEVTRVECPRMSTTPIPMLTPDALDRVATESTGEQRFGFATITRTLRSEARKQRLVVAASLLDVPEARSAGWSGSFVREDVVPALELPGDHADSDVPPDPEIATRASSSSLAMAAAAARRQETIPCIAELEVEPVHLVVRRLFRRVLHLQPCQYRTHLWCPLPTFRHRRLARLPLRHWRIQASADRAIALPL